MLQIVPGCSVKRRKSTPKRDWTSSGTTHQAETRPVASAVRQPKASTARHVTAPTQRSYSASSSGPTSIQAVTAAFTPPPLAVTISANAAAHHHGLPRMPRRTATSSQGSAA